LILDEELVSMLVMLLLFFFHDSNRYWRTTETGHRTKQSLSPTLATPTWSWYETIWRWPRSPTLSEASVERKKTENLLMTGPTEQGSWWLSDRHPIVIQERSQTCFRQKCNK
jgi:hypothetical protein